MNLAGLAPARFMYRCSGLDVIGTPTQAVVEWAIACDARHDEVETEQDKHDSHQTQQQ
jgi:hypothetical protein